jgi:hypothetical protein
MTAYFHGSTDFGTSGTDLGQFGKSVSCFFADDG